MRGQLTDIGALFRALRGKEGVTQKELAERAGIAQARVSEVELGTGEEITVKTILRHAAALGYAVEIWLKPLKKKVKKNKNS